MVSQLLALQLLHEYGAERMHVFPSRTSMTRFLRRHKSPLIEAGALVMICGRWFVEAEKFDCYVLAEGCRAAVRRSRQFDV
jgi:hypothetical protein